MRKFSQSDAYVKFRLATGVIFMLLGVAIVVQGFAAPGPMGAKVPLFVLAAAMFLLGFFRLRTYMQARAALKR